MGPQPPPVSLSGAPASHVPPPPPPRASPASETRGGPHPTGESMGSGAAQPDAAASRWAPPRPAGTPPLDVLREPPPIPNGPAPQGVPDVAFTLADLEQVVKVPNMGGKRACKWQRELRDQCIANGETEADITRDPEHDWKQVLRAANPTFAAGIIGDGIVRVLFRIIETERDVNYINVDSHGRHYFDFIRANGSAMRLHYHNNGSTDAPIYLAPLGAAQPPAPGAAPTLQHAPGGGAAQPAASSGGRHVPLPVTWQHIQEAARLRHQVGRHEASAAFQTLLHHHHGASTAGAVDITNGAAFDWIRWLAQLACARDVIGGGVHRVYAVRWLPHQDPEAVFCYRDHTYCTLAPNLGRYGKRQGGNRVTTYWFASWRTEALLCQAPEARTSWIQVQSEMNRQ